jgi:hypothetical protein
MNGAHDDSRLEFEAAVAADDVKEWWTVLGGFEYSVECRFLGIGSFLFCVVAA